MTVHPSDLTPDIPVGSDPQGAMRGVFDQVDRAYVRKRTGVDVDDRLNGNRASDAMMPTYGAITEIIVAVR